MYLQQIDSYAELVLRSAAIISSLIIVFIFGFLWFEVSGFSLFANVFIDTNWNPTEGQFNMLPMLAATMAATSGAVLLTIPFGVLSGIFLRLFASPTIAKIFRRTLEILAGIPSVVYGLWGLTTLVPLINEIASPGAGLFTCILVLAIMIVPTAALMMDSAFRAISDEEIRPIKSMGLGSWSIFRLVLFPKALPALITAILLATGRAIGETMAVLMVAGNIVQMPTGLFKPIRTMTANIALELGYAEGDHRAALFVCGFILLSFIAVLFSLTSFAEKKFSLEV